MVAVGKLERDRGTGCHALHHARQDCGAILLDRHAVPGAGSGLTAREIDGDQRLGERQAGRHALENRGQCGAMRFA
jgi:hypothetical protein